MRQEGLFCYPSKQSLALPSRRNLLYADDEVCHLQRFEDQHELALRSCHCCSYQDQQQFRCHQQEEFHQGRSHRTTGTLDLLQARPKVCKLTPKDSCQKSTLRCNQLTTSDLIYLINTPVADIFMSFWTDEKICQHSTIDGT